jgi:hypothetical protein
MTMETTPSEQTGIKHTELIKHARQIVKHFTHVRYDVKEVIIQLCDALEGKENEHASSRD